MIYNLREEADIALCNLASVNLKTYDSLNDEERRDLAKIIVKALDNTIDIAYYPVLDAKKTNQKFRYLGVGALNAANWLAGKKIEIDSEEAQEEFDRIFDDLSYNLYDASCDLAIEKGPYQEYFNDDNLWKEGLTPIHQSLKYFPDAWNLTNYQIDLKRWDKLAEKIQKHGIRNKTVMAIAPTASSGKSINCTESVEPIHDFIYMEEGTTTVTTLAPNVLDNIRYYKKAFDCNQENLVKNAAIRQKYIDQAQSVTLYLTDDKVRSLKYLTDLHLLGFNLGLKTYYYQKQTKIDFKQCESCTL